MYSAPNAGLGIVCHSIEGSVDGALSRFLSTDRDANGNYTPAAQASVMFINPLAGTLIQMYPVTASTWTSGNAFANTHLWAVESEGKAGMPLNDNQVANMLRLCQEYEAHTGRTATRGQASPALPRTIWQHNEVWDWSTPNAGPTACPSGRYDAAFEALEGDMGLTEEQVTAIVEQALAEQEFVQVGMFRRYLELVFNTTDPATFTDTNGKPLGPPKAVSDYIAALAKGGASVALVYADLARMTRERGGKFIIDTHGPALKAATEARPYLVRLNHLEAQELLGGDADVAAHTLARALVRQGLAEIAIVTLGERGAIVASHDEEFELTPPRVTVRSSVGAGDSFVAALTLGLARQWPLREAARFAVAAAAAAVTSEATELCKRPDVERNYRAIGGTMLAPA